VFDLGELPGSQKISVGHAKPDTSYEIRPICNSEPQNIEQEISNDEAWNRFAVTISD